MPSRWSFEAVVAAPPDAVYAWMSDFTEDDHARPAFKRGAGVKPGDKRESRRHVVSRDGNRLRVEDSWGRERFGMDVELAPGAREVRLSGQYGYRGVWRALPHGGATRVVSEGSLEPTGFARFFAPLFAGMLMKQMRADFDGHIEDMRESLVGPTKD